MFDKFKSAFINHLRVITKIPSCYDNEKGRKDIILYSLHALKEFLPLHNIKIDIQGNLTAFPPNAAGRKTIIYLSAHVDTVGADPENWMPPYHPFIPFENEAEYVARGVNDCKAGVAFELAFAQCAPDPLKNNIVFTLTSKEEGAGEKTAVSIGREIGKQLPLGKDTTFLIVLENTTQVTSPTRISAFTKERGNYAVILRTDLKFLAQWLKDRCYWMPTAIKPIHKAYIDDSYQPDIYRSDGGHVASPKSPKNFLKELISKNLEYTIITAGISGDFSTVPQKIFIQRSQCLSNIHLVTLNNRSNASIHEVTKQLEGLSYQTIKSFDISCGFNAAHTKGFVSLLNNLKSLNSSDSCVEIGVNPGNSDASHIFNSIPKGHQNKVTPIVIGPGCRSQRDATPPRLTHGPNETLNKCSAFDSAFLIIQLIEKQLNTTWLMS